MVEISSQRYGKAEFFLVTTNPPLKHRKVHPTWITVTRHNSLPKTHSYCQVPCSDHIFRNESRTILPELTTMMRYAPRQTSYLTNILVILKIIFIYVIPTLVFVVLVYG